MPPKNLKKGTQEMKDYMAMIRSKKGKGILDMVKSGAKSLAKMGIDAGASKLKDMVGNGKMKKSRGKGLAGDVLRFVGNKAVDLTGLGMSDYSIQAPGRLLKGKALYNAGY